MKKNILIFIHGMVPDENNHPPEQKYLDFQKNLFKANKNLEHKLEDIIYVHWGHQHQKKVHPEFTDDQYLTQAEQYLIDKTHYDARSSSPNNVITMDFPNLILHPLRSKLILPGLGDVIYYCSEEGETIIRESIYQQILSQLEPVINEPINLHFFGHSLGAMISHDFLYGIFNSKGTSDYSANKQINADYKNLYDELRKKVANNTLSLGSFTCCASQIPLLLLRKPSLVSRFYQRKPLDPAEIGIKELEEGFIKWQLFYDVDDPLSFITRPIYKDSNKNIKEIQVNCGGGISAHISYWDNKTIAKETAKLIANNLA